MRLSLLLGALCLAALCLAACSADDSAGRRIVQRFITEESNDFFERTDLLQLETVETWRFASSEDLTPWRQELFDRFEQRGLHLVLQSSKRRPRLVRQVSWQADDIHAIEILLGGFSRGIGRIYWAGEDEKFSEARSLIARRTNHVDPERIVFDLTFHPLWRGKIDKLRVQFEIVKQESPIFLREIRPTRFRPVAEQVAAAASRPWKIDLNHEARNGFLALPGLPIERQWQIPAAATLKVGFGMGPGAHRPVRFGAEIAVAGEEPVSLFEETITPEPGADGPAQGRWYDRELDLSPWDGQEATLRLTADSGDGPASQYDLIQGLAYWAHPEMLAPVSSSEQLPNIVLISIDTLRADHMSLYGYERATTPRIDDWASRRATVFESSVASSPWTVPSHLSLLSGLDALNHGLNHSGQPVPARFQLMAEELRELGYSTLAVTGGGFMRPTEGFGQGFERYRYWPKTQSEDELTVGVEQALAAVESVRDQPFLLFFHTYEVHWPYRRRAPFFADFMGQEIADSPEVYIGITDGGKTPESGFLLDRKLFWKPEKRVLERTPVTGAKWSEVVGRYDSGVAFADLHVARLLARLEAEDLADRTVVLITSDHGEALGERDLGGHAYLDDFNLWVPLIVSLPDGRGWGERIAQQVRGIDLLPTVRELVGKTATPVDGSSLLPLIDDPDAEHPPEAWSYAAFSNRGIALRVDNRWKYRFNNTAWPPLPGLEKLFDLQADPGEERDLAGSGRDVTGFRRRVREQLATWTETKLRVELRNGSARAIRGRVRGTGIHPAVVKTDGIPPGGLTWVKLGMADFELPAGERFTFYLERIEGRLLRFEIDRDGGVAPFPADIVVENLATDWQITREGGGWKSGPVADADSVAAETAILVRRPVLPDGAVEELRSAADPKILEQLEALGYVP